MTAAVGSDPFTRPQLPRGNTVRLRVEFFGYEREVIETQINAYLKKLSRKHPSFQAQDFQLKHVHELMQFQVVGETSHVPAYDYFPIKVCLIQQVRPAQLYLSANLPSFEQNFVSTDYINAHVDSLRRSTILQLDTENGFLPTPPMSAMTIENELVVSTFHLNILLENLSFATHPFQIYSSVEARGGTLHFPANPSYFGQPVQQTQYYAHQLPTFSVPAPVLEPPQLVNSMNDDPLPWNVLQQRYMDVNRARNDQQNHARTVRDLLNPTVSNNSTENVRPVLSVSAPSTTVLTSPPTSTSSFSTTHVDPPTTQSQPVTTQPVVPSAASAIAATQSGLSQSRPDDVVQQLQPSSVASIPQPGSVLSQPQISQSDSLSGDDSVDLVQNVTSLVPTSQYSGDPRLQSLFTVCSSSSGQPNYRINFPHLLHGVLGFNDLNYRLANVDNMSWDDINLNLSHQIDHFVPQPSPHASRMLPGLGPPLAQSIGQPSTTQRYPVQVRNSNNPFGPRCPQTPIPSFPTPNLIQPDLMASQPLITTMSITAPVMSATPAVTSASAAVILGQAATASDDPLTPSHQTGARQKVLSGNSVQTTDQVPVSSSVTQNQSGISNILSRVTRRNSKRSQSDPHFK